MEPAGQLMHAHEPERGAGLVDHARSLWAAAPAWRLLLASTSALVASAVLTPLLLARGNEGTHPPVEPVSAAPAPSGSCPIANWSTPGGEGTVVGFMSAGQAASLLARTQAAVGASINPAFLHNARAIIGVPDARGGRKAIELVPLGVTVKAGDRVRYAGGFRDATLPCNYVPPLISGPTAGR